MAEIRNLANAAVIIACLYFLNSGNLGIWATGGLIVILLLAMCFWQIIDSKARDKITQSKLEVEHARALNFHAGTKQLLIQSKLFEKGLTR